LKLVIDASVALKWLMPDAPGEQDVSRAVAILSTIQSGDVDLVAPHHWTLEIMAVVARGGEDQVPAAMEFLTSLPFHTVQSDRVLERAAKMSARLDHHIFDTLYHAVALETSATLVTADERYFAKAHGEGGLELLANFRT
jgi:predicted nucleic acid-binding protein